MTGTQHGFFHLDEIADARAFANVTAGAQVSKRSDGRAGLDARARDHGVVEDRDAIADLRIDDARAAVDFAAAADRRPPLERYQGCRMVSGPIVTSSSMYAVSGSSIVTPASMSCVVFSCRTISSPPPVRGGC